MKRLSECSLREEATGALSVCDPPENCTNKVQYSCDKKAIIGRYTVKKLSDFAAEESR